MPQATKDKMPLAEMVRLFQDQAPRYKWEATRPGLNRDGSSAYHFKYTGGIGVCIYGDWHFSDRKDDKSWAAHGIAVTLGTGDNVTVLGEARAVRYPETGETPSELCVQLEDLFRKAREKYLDSRSGVLV